MLTPDVIKDKVFQASGRGAYRAEDVDAFLADVAKDYAQMYKENGELVKKISILANKVEKYKAQEESVNRALISAQTLADKIVKEANESVEGAEEKAKQEAEEILIKARKDAKDLISSAEEQSLAVVAKSEKQAEEILGSVNRKMTQKSLEFEMLQKKASAFRTDLIAMYKEHLALINSIPEYIEEELAAEDKEEAVKAEEAPTEAAPQVEAEAPTPAEPVELPEEEVAEPQAEVAEAAQPTEAEDEYEDISSGAELDEEEDAKEADAEEGFSLDISVFDDAEEEEEIEQPAADQTEDAFTLDIAALEDAPSAQSAKAEEKLNDAQLKLDFSAEKEAQKPAHSYAVIEEESEEETDETPSSFKSFFKKK